MVLIKTEMNHGKPQAPAQAILKSVFGFSSFRGAQESVVHTLLEERKNALVLMPTGMGKSLCYQLPARYFAERGEGLTLVISPLIALMKDQVDAALKKGLRACYINSSLSSSERQDRIQKLRRGSYELVYVTPERFRQSEFCEALAKNALALLAVDEAHCISAWGHDFRPDYSRLGEIRDGLGAPMTVALTATATPAVQKDILQALSLDASNCRVIHTGIDRPNLALRAFSVHGQDEKIQALVGYRHVVAGPVIVYFSLVQTLRSFSRELGRLGLTHWQYHGQMNDRERKRSQEGFLADDQGLILATPAFGLGVDKENVRLVVHAELPGSVEAYYQEVGRGGRDGLPAQGLVLYDQDDVSIQVDFLRWSNPDPGFIQSVYNLIERNPHRVRQEGHEFLRSQLNFYNRRDFRVETAVNLLERWGAIEGRDPRQWKAIEAPVGEYLDEDLYRARLRSQKQKLYEMVAWVELAEGCRMQEINRYFGLPVREPCRICDLCEKTKGSGHVSV